MTLSYMIHWHDYNVANSHRKVKRIQEAIVVAYNKGDIGRSKRQRNNLIRSRDAAYLAVKRVRTNRGKLTPGIDGIVWNTPELKEQAIKRLRETKWDLYTATRVKRVYIPNSKERTTPLRIPTRFDRAAQRLWQRSLDPIAECWADQNSYGFRKSRRTHDAAQRIFLLCARNKGKPVWVRNVDIKGFYDQIDPKWIVNTIPIEKNVLTQWLKVGALHRNMNESITINAGVQEDRIISPTIANMALDGLEYHLKDNAPIRKVKRKKRSRHVHVIRYADQFVITSGSRDVIEHYVKPQVKEFLKERGLELDLQNLSIKEINHGFDFLGFRFGRYTTKAKSKTSGKVFLLKPTNRNIIRFRQQLQSIVKDSRGRTAGQLIAQLNPILRRWAEYYKGASSKQVFSAIDSYLWKIIWRWAKRKHTGKSKYEIVKQYFKTVEKRNWVFSGELHGKELALYHRASTKIKRHILIAKNQNPYLSKDLKYFEKREKNQSEHGIWSVRKLNILKQQDYRCPVCLQFLKSGEDVDLHHVVPQSKGGTDEISNMKALHRECHRSVTFTRSKKALARYYRRGVLGDQENTLTR